jgi:aspartyl-tRNA(Asn)/glutamyl-tRNA(Gln) amidotransferase subunit A
MQERDSPVRDKPTKKVRLGIPRQYFLDILDGEVRALFDATVDRIRSTGCLVETVEISDAAEIRRTYLHTQLREAFDAHSNILKKHASDYTPNVRERLELGRSVSDADYTRAQITRDVLRGQVNIALEERQALILPTLSIPAPPLGVTEVTIDEHTSDLRSLMLRQTQLFNLTGHPVISIPCGETSDGLPCAVQLVGHLGKTNQLLSLASRYEPSIRNI